MEIKQKTIFLIFGILFSLMVVISSLVYFDEEKDFNNILLNKKQLLDNTYKLAKERTDEKFISHLNTLKVLPNLATLIREGKRKELYTMMSPLYNGLQKNANQSVNVYHFYLPDGTSFLRLHKPDKFGDNNYDTRPLLRKAIMTKKIATGYEIGHFGLFYRIEYPLLEDGELFSVLDLGIYFKEFDTYLDSLTDVHSVMLSDQHKVLNGSYSVGNIDGLSIVDGSETAIQVLEKLNRNLSPEGQLLRYQKKFYYTHIISISNMNSEIIAKRIYFIDVTQAYAKKINTLITFILINIIALILITLILSKNIGIILKKLIESEDRFKSLFENMENPIIIYHWDDKTKKFVHQEINKSAQSLLSLSRQKSLFNTSTCSSSDRQASCLCDALKKVYITSVSIKHTSVEQEEKDIHSWYENQIYKLPNEDIVCIIHDLTEDKRAEIIKKEMEDELESLNNDLNKRVEIEIKKNREQASHMLQQSRLAQMGEMISMIAHQWRQPLASISSISGTLTLDVMMDSYKKGFFQERLESISELSQYLSATINDFRNFFQAEKEKKKVNLDEIVSQGLHIISSSLENKNILIEKDINKNIELTTYPNEIKQVLLNLLKNAEEALGENNIIDGKIRIQGHMKNAMAYLRVEDNAGGISEDIIEKVFDPYFSTKTKKDGTGLGLYMSKTIIEEHCNGSITAENISKGICFTIVLPLELVGDHA